MWENKKCSKPPIRLQTHQDRAAEKALKTPWQAHSHQGLVKTAPKCQALETAWQRHSFQPLIETLTKS